MDKYYTPDISEFCYGLVYQIRSSSLTPSESDWSDLIYDEGDDEMSFSQIGGIIRDGDIRIKLLDVDDIISCGWEEIKEEDTTNKFFKKGDYKICLTPKLECIIVRLVITGMAEQIFRGTIKNKSELIKLFNQLGIL